MERKRSHFTTKRVGDKKYETTIGLKPINYLKNGFFVPIDPKFLPGQAGAAFETDQLTLIRLAPNSSAPLMTFGRGTTQVVFDVSNDNNVAALAGARDNEVIYPGILPGISAHIFSGGHIVSFELRGALQNKSLEFKLTPQGSSYEILPDKIKFKDAKGNTIFNFGLDFEVWQDPDRDNSVYVRASAVTSQGKIVVSVVTPDTPGLDRLV